MNLAVERYLRDVLGIQRILMLGSAGQVADASSDFDPRLYFLLEEVWTDTEESVFQKMVLALKLGSHEFVCLKKLNELRELKKPPRYLVSFQPLDAEDLAGQDPSSSGFWICTPGPRSFLQDPTLKRQTWSDLQEAHRRYIASNYK